LLIKIQVNYIYSKITIPTLKDFCSTVIPTQI